MVYFPNKNIIVLGTITLIGLGVLAICLGLFLVKSKSCAEGTMSRDGSCVSMIYRGGVTSNGHECAGIGGEIIGKGGSAVDAAIAALFCEGIAMPQSMGLGGGFFMTIYSRTTGEVFTINSREIAPENAHTDMFEGNSSIATKGGLAVAVPGELRGYWAVHKKFGLLPWADLIKPTIDLCKKGHYVTKYLSVMLSEEEKDIKSSPSLAEIYIDPKTNNVYKEGDFIKREDLVKTLEIISKEGADALYNGSLTKPFLDDVLAFKGNMTIKDLNNYQPEWIEPIKVKLPFNQTMYTMPLPGSGVILTFMLNILKGFIDYSKPTSVTTIQRIVESFKYGYGKRTEMGDPHFVNMTELIANLTSEAYAEEIRNNISDFKTYADPKHYGANVSLTEDHGTAHLSVLHPNGDAVAVTSTINLLFGAGIRSRSTGIILNNEMDDFSSPNIDNAFGMPPSPNNYIKPGKRPVSSMCPTIILDKNNDVRLVIGASGGTKITTSVALVTIKHLWFNQTLEDAVSSKRIHHQLFPMLVQYESNFDKNIVNGLAEIGHNYTVSKTDGFAALTAVARVNGSVEGSFDRRRGGSVVLIQ